MNTHLTKCFCNVQGYRNVLHKVIVFSLDSSLPKKQLGLWATIFFRNTVFHNNLRSKPSQTQKTLAYYH